MFLVGLMGAGKTSVGKVLARRLQKTFIDADQALVEKTGVSIPTIFEIEGESGFRGRERALLAELSHADNIVLATGGGIVLDPANRETLRQSGLVIYLRASPEELHRRTRQDKNRPLLQNGNRLDILRRLHAQRDPLYEEVADLVVDTGTQSITKLASAITKQLGERAQFESNVA